MENVRSMLSLIIQEFNLNQNATPSDLMSPAMGESMAEATAKVRYRHNNVQCRTEHYTTLHYSHYLTFHYTTLNSPPRHTKLHCTTLHSYPQPHKSHYTSHIPGNRWGPIISIRIGGQCLSGVPTARTLSPGPWIQNYGIH